MNLLVDARTAFDPKPRGIGKTLIQLYRHVAAIRDDWRFTLLHRNPDRTHNPFEGLDNIRPCHIEMPGDRMGLWEKIRLPLTTLRRRPSLLHCPANTAPRLCPAPLLLTIHDLIPMDLPDLSAQSKLFETHVRRAAKQARHILTPSAFSAGRIETCYGIDPKRISVLPWAANDDMKLTEDPESLAACRTRHFLGDQKLVLMFAAEDPRKNTQRVLRAWGALPESIRLHWRLVLVGLNDRARTRVDSTLRELNLDSSSVRALGYVPREDIPLLMSLADILCFPSLSEGFGLPILDAFVTRTAVITSNCSSLPEVAGDAAILVDPTCGDAIADALHKLITDPRLRANYVQKGLQREALYHWQATATTFINVIETHFS
ncbi:MAG: glycosyltransferase family 4 protein [Phycisphaerales bacterium]|jgi:glycosyltransferase involved in cell wall biosynthesis|nr:glycosyltransferase family 4 protein [Phycisphaerales bacterium]MBT7170560.1 glycosyltransferase family 4 protein [Phycisphaerales bacterium]